MNEPKESPHARNFMTSHVEVVTPEMPLSEVIRFLLKHHVSNAPVVETRNGKHFLVGIRFRKRLFVCCFKMNYFSAIPVRHSALKPL